MITMSPTPTPNSKITLPTGSKGYQGKDMAWNSDFEKAKDEIDEFYVDPDPAAIRLFE